MHDWTGANYPGGLVKSGCAGADDPGGLVLFIQVDWCKVGDHFAGSMLMPVLLGVGLESVASDL